MRNSGT